MHLGSAASSRGRVSLSRERSAPRPRPPTAAHSADSRWPLGRSRCRREPRTPTVVLAIVDEHGISEPEALCGKPTHRRRVGSSAFRTWRSLQHSSPSASRRARASCRPSPCRRAVVSRARRERSSNTAALSVATTRHACGSIERMQSVSSRSPPSPGSRARSRCATRRRAGRRRARRRCTTPASVHHPVAFARRFVNVRRRTPQTLSPPAGG